MSRPRVLALVATVASGIGLLLLFLAAPREELGNAVSGVQSPSFTGYDAEGAPAWTLRAARGSLDGEQGAFEEPEIVFHSKDAAPLTATADRFTFDGEVGALSGRVRVERADGYRMETESLTFRESARVIQADSVAILSEAGRVEASGLVCDLNKGKSEVGGGFVAELGDPALRIHGDRAEEAAGTLSLYGNLKIERSGEAWRADWITVVEGTGTMTLGGQVEGTLPEGRITADSLALTAEGTSAAHRARLVLERRFFARNHGS